MYLNNDKQVPPTCLKKWINDWFRICCNFPIVCTKSNYSMCQKMVQLSVTHCHAHHEEGRKEITVTEWQLPHLLTHAVTTFVEISAHAESVTDPFFEARWHPLPCHVICNDKEKRFLGIYMGFICGLRLSFDLNIMSSKFSSVFKIGFAASRSRTVCPKMRRLSPILPFQKKQCSAKVKLP